MYGHVLAGDGALEAADDRRRAPVGVVLPRPAAVPGERARGRAGGPARRRCAARRGAPGASSTTFSTTSSPVASSRYAMPVRDADPSRRWTSLDGDAAHAGRRRARARAGRARARASAAGRRFACSAPAASPSLSVGARQSCSRGPAASTFRPPVASSREHARVEVDDGANAAGLEHAVVRRPERRGRVRASRLAAGRCSCCQATSWPAGGPVRSPRAGRSGT